MTCLELSLFAGVEGARESGGGVVQCYLGVCSSSSMFGLCVVNMQTRNRPKNNTWVWFRATGAAWSLGPAEISLQLSDD